MSVETYSVLLVNLIQVLVASLVASGAAQQLMLSHRYCICGSHRLIKVILSEPCWSISARPLTE